MSERDGADAAASTSLASDSGASDGRGSDCGAPHDEATSANKTSRVITRVTMKRGQRARTSGMLASDSRV